MGRDFLHFGITAVALTILALSIHPAHAEKLASLLFSEERRLHVRDPSQLAAMPLPELARPATVAAPEDAAPQRLLSLDEAIRIALANAEVVRVLAGVRAVSSGRTIYDPAISSERIDEERARFDPTLSINNGFNRFERPQAFTDPVDPSRAQIEGTRQDDYNMGLDLSKSTTTGGVANFRVNSNPTRFRPGFFPLNPQNRSSMELGYRQPLLRGGGVRPNVAPIVIARIDTERSFFQLKDSLQEMVRGVIEAYWGLVFARTDAWARQQQVEQGQFAFDLAQARMEVRLGDVADVAQARVALANFRANLIASRAGVLNREAALLNILGLPPSEAMRPIPVTPPAQEDRDFDWNSILALAAQRRPDIIERKLVLEADQQRLVQAENQALPAVDAVTLYRWNGLEGRMPNGNGIASGPGQFTDWTLGVNFSVPLGLRQSRASLRRQELLIARDRADLQQSLHSASHDLAANLRNLDQFYEQYEAFRETRAAAEINLRQQGATYRSGQTIFLNVLQAITDWGNAVSSEAQSLTQYNTEMGNLERQSGTILESHGIRLYEERFGSIGPLGRMFRDRPYPRDMAPSPNAGVYPANERPAEEAFHLEPPFKRRGRTRLPQAEALPDPAPGRALED
ncbi:MAG: TolC family protein [Pirellulales bacterium]